MDRGFFFSILSIVYSSVWCMIIMVVYACVLLCLACLLAALGCCLNIYIVTIF
jgi:hypothetical protein